LNEEQTDAILELVEKIEEDEDVQAVYHNLR
jgi:transcriptional/translational regulatory protein YebC/TACO1